MTFKKAGGKQNKRYISKSICYHYLEPTALTVLLHFPLLYMGMFSKL